MANHQPSFARPFAEIWQYSPFQPSTHIAEFVERFTVAGKFDAERFWEFVSRTGKKPVQRSQAYLGRRLRVL